MLIFQTLQMLKAVIDIGQKKILMAIIFFTLGMLREIWIDVTKYDALESDLHDKGENESCYAENDYFADAARLNARGKIKPRN